MHADMEALNLQAEENEPLEAESLPKMSLAREKLLEEARRAIEKGDAEGKKGVSLVVIGELTDHASYGI